jgi:hypothetical protein
MESTGLCNFNVLLLTFPHHGRAASEGRDGRAPLRGVRPVPRIPLFFENGRGVVLQWSVLIRRVADFDLLCRGRRQT